MAWKRTTEASASRLKTRAPAGLSAASNGKTRRRSAPVALFAATALVALAAGGAARASELGAEDIRHLLIGPTLHWWAEDTEFQGEVVFDPSGRAAIASDNPSTLDEGQWRFAGDELCTTWRHARGGVEKCYRVRRVAASRFTTTGGNVFEIQAPGS